MCACMAVTRNLPTLFGRMPDVFYALPLEHSGRGERRRGCRRGGGGDTEIKLSAEKLTSEEKTILPPLLPGVQSATFCHESRALPQSFFLLAGKGLSC